MKRMRMNGVMVVLLAAVLGLFAAQAGWAAYVDNGNGTVTDTVTGLTWQKGDAQNDGGGRTWEQAMAYCEGLTLAGRTDWRLPNVRELASIVDDSRYDPAIDPIFCFRSGNYWSSSTVVNYPDNAWDVSFDVGGVIWYFKSYSFYVRCVRGGPTATGSGVRLLLLE